MRLHACNQSVYMYNKINNIIIWDSYHHKGGSGKKMLFGDNCVSRARAPPIFERSSLFDCGCTCNCMYAKIIILILSLLSSELALKYKEVCKSSGVSLKKHSEILRFLLTYSTKFSMAKIDRIYLTFYFH